MYYLCTVHYKALFFVSQLMFHISKILIYVFNWNKKQSCPGFHMSADPSILVGFSIVGDLTRFVNALLRSLARATKCRRNGIGQGYESVIKHTFSDCKGVGKLSQVLAGLPNVKAGVGFFTLNLGKVGHL